MIFSIDGRPGVSFKREILTTGLIIRETSPQRVRFAVLQYYRLSLEEEGALGSEVHSIYYQLSNIKITPKTTDLTIFFSSPTINAATDLKGNQHVKFP